MNTTEQQSREAFENHFEIATATRRGGWYIHSSSNDCWEGWQAALQFAQGQQTKQPTTVSQPQPPEGYHLATEEEWKCLPEGSKFWEIDEWVFSANIGCDVSSYTDIYACPDHPPLVTFTDGKLNPPPHGQWHRSDWTQEMLGVGWRPLLEGEKPQQGDQLDRETHKHNMWTNLSGQEAPVDSAVDRSWFYRTRRPLPPVPAEEWVPLGPEDVPPGSVFAVTGEEQFWCAALEVTHNGVVMSSGNGDGVIMEWEDLVKDEWNILRPGQDWQPCKKLKQP